MAGPGQSAFWDQRYEGSDFAFGAEPNVCLASQAALFQRGQRVLVPGDGEGRNGVWLAQQGLLVDTVDASPKGVEKALALATARGVTINATVADLTTWVWPRGLYDAVVSIYLHFDVALSRTLHQKMLAALVPGGYVLLEAYTPRQLEFRKTGSIGGPQDVQQLFTKERLRADFAEADIVLLEEADIDLAEGKRHTGRSAVIRMIARKRA